MAAMSQGVRVREAIGFMTAEMYDICARITRDLR